MTTLIVWLSAVHVIGLIFGYSINSHSPYLENTEPWRNDLLGKQRKLEVLRTVDADSDLGPIKGFVVELYDNPLPNSGFNPHQNQVEEVQASVNVFLGIPYAKPPINEFRFEPPQPPNVHFSLNAIDYGPICPQPQLDDNSTTSRVSEDCLYLNVFAPNKLPANSRKLPVMVYIHGGFFERGSSNDFPGHVMAAFYDVIVVTFNYRLGALGFLSNNDNHLPGNYGILDQIAALKWIHGNIENFNGDRNAITVFGPDAGAASAVLLAILPQSRHFVQKVIAQSGSILADWAFFTDFNRIANITRNFAKSIGCDYEILWNCIKKRSPMEIGNVQLTGDFVGFYPWAPVLTGAIVGRRQRQAGDFSRTPKFLLENGLFHPELKVLIGLTSCEAAEMLTARDLRNDRVQFNRLVSEFIRRFNYTINSERIFDAIDFMYTKWPQTAAKHNDFIRNYIDLLSDQMFVAPANQLADLLVRNNVSVFMYVLNGTVDARQKPQRIRFGHNTETDFLMGAPFLDPEMLPDWRRGRGRGRGIANLTKDAWSNNDRLTSHYFMKAYTNFAKYGHPSLKFERITPQQFRYLNINQTFENSSIETDFRTFQTHFWIDYLPLLLNGKLFNEDFRFGSFFWPYDPRSSQTLLVAFWSASIVALFLFFLSVAFCILWRHEKSKLRLTKDLMMLEPNLMDGGGGGGGIGGLSGSAAVTDFDEHQYHHLDLFPEMKTSLIRPTKPDDDELRLIKTASLNTTTGMTGGNGFERNLRSQPKTLVIEGVPQTDV